MGVSVCKYSQKENRKIHKSDAIVHMGQNFTVSKTVVSAI